MSDDITSAMAAVDRWIGNPFSRALLRFVVTHDECGDRLSNAIDQYLEKEVSLCWKCRLAGRIVSYTLEESSHLFGVSSGRLYCSIELSHVSSCPSRWGTSGSSSFLRSGTMRKY